MRKAKKQAAERTQKLDERRKKVKLGMAIKIIPFCPRETFEVL